MMPAENQIVAILTESTFKWAQEQLAPEQSLDDYTYKDFIDVTPAEIKKYVDANGFPGTTVYEKGSPFAVILDDQLQITKSWMQWEVCYMERGRKSEIVHVATRDAAHSEIVKRRVRTAKIMLNHRFRLAHSSLSLPRPDEME